MHVPQRAAGSRGPAGRGARLRRATPSPAAAAPRPRGAGAGCGGPVRRRPARAPAAATSGGAPVSDSQQLGRGLDALAAQLVRVRAHRAQVLLHLGLGDVRAAPAGAHQQPALLQPVERLAQRHARDAERRRELALRRQARTRAAAHRAPSTRAAAPRSAGTPAAQAPAGAGARARRRCGHGLLGRLEGELEQALQLVEAAVPRARVGQVDAERLQLRARRRGPALAQELDVGPTNASPCSR